MYKKKNQTTKIQQKHASFMEKVWRTRAQRCILEEGRRTLHRECRGLLPELYEHEPLSVKAEAIGGTCHKYI